MTPVLRPLTAQDTEALATFTCESYREPWTALVQEMIREHLAGNLAIDSVSAIGAWTGDELVGVAAWRIDGAVCRSVVLAVRTGYRRLGLGGLLKDTVLAEARGAGAVAVVSHVHSVNEAMLRLNARRGATTEQCPDDDHLLCVIPVDV